MLQAETASTQFGVWPPWAPTRAVRLDGRVGRVAKPSRARSGETATILPFPYWVPPADPASKIEPEQRPSPRDKLQAELQSYMALPHGWDGYDGVPASLDAITDVFLFLDKRPDDVRLPYPQLGPDGEVGLYWHTSEGLAEVSFYGDGGYSYHAECTPAAGRPVTVGKDECPVTEDWAPELLLALGKIVP